MKILKTLLWSVRQPGRFIRKLLMPIKIKIKACNEKRQQYEAKVDFMLNALNGIRLSLENLDSEVKLIKEKILLER